MIAIDLFAGLGGSTEGARLAGVPVRLAANHSPLAVEWHGRNHPDVAHWTQDLQQADFSRAPSHDLLLASPSCQGHTHARGAEQPRHDAQRATAWAVVTCAEVHRPAAVVVENVPEFTDWILWPAWRAAMEALGYRLSTTVLDAADFGVPQHRRRVFVLALRGRGTALVPGVPSPGLPHVPASSFVRLDDSYRWSPVAGHVEKTLARVEAGRRAFGDTFLMPYYSRGSGLTGRSLDRPIGTITCWRRWAVVRGDEMRMLSADELRAAMGFQEGYQLPRNETAASALLGNAVPPPMMAGILRFVQEVA